MKRYFIFLSSCEFWRPRTARRATTWKSAAVGGWTGSWLPGTSCTKFGCEHPCGEVGFLDYGLRGIVPAAAGRVELSAGLGGGYIRISDSTRPADPLGVSTSSIVASVGATSFTAIDPSYRPARMPGPMKISGTCTS